MKASLSPAILSLPAQVDALFSEAAGSRVFILSQSGLQSVPRAGESLRQLLYQASLGRNSLDTGAVAVLGSVSLEDLGHAPAWMDAGAVFEELESHLASGSDPCYVFCLDPWAGQLLMHSGDLGSRSKWIYVSDLEERKRSGSVAAYWEALETWLRELPFTAIVPKALLAQAVQETGVSTKEAAAPRDNRIFAEQPGAWQWRVLRPALRPGKPPQGSLLFVCLYSGSLAHLRVFLDSVARQSLPREAIELVIAAPAEKADFESYLKWLALAHPSLRVRRVSMSAEDPKTWKLELNRRLSEVPQSTVVLLSDHCILPKEFGSDLLEGPTAEQVTAFSGLRLGIPASAHIVTGNLDPIEHYEKLLQGSVCVEILEQSEIARSIPSQQWAGREGEPFTRVFGLARESAPVQGPALLVLSDLP